jgi:CRP/FNR family transcriptional regulator, cyclic AMP receptor protein
MPVTLPKPANPIGAALADFGLFATLGPDTLDRLGRVARRGSWAAGSYLFHRDDDGDHMIALTAGRVRLSLGSAQGRELVLRHATAGDIIGELALLDGEPRSADARVLEDAVGIVLPRNGFQSVAEERPELGLALARHLSGLLRNTNYQMESIAIYDLQMRVVRFFLLSLRQVYGEDLPATAKLQTGLNQSDLSAILGASRPKVNRALQDLITEGALRRDGADWICVIPKLAEIAESEGPEG